MAVDFDTILSTTILHYRGLVERELIYDYYFGTWRLLVGLPWPASDPNPMPYFRPFRWLP
jgi:hypothetical protein